MGLRPQPVINFRTTKNYSDPYLGAIVRGDRLRAAKDRANQAKHGLSLARSAEFDILAVQEDRRIAREETRYRAFGLLDGLPHCLAFTVRDGVGRAISLRRAHLKEYRRYVR